MDKIALPAPHVVHGEEFPYALQLSDPTISTLKQKVAFLSAEAAKGTFNALTDKHGAVVLRGFGTTDTSELSALVGAIADGSGYEPFEQNGALASRTDLPGTVFSTANEGPPEMTLFQHNEFARFKRFPRRLFFVCTEFSAEAGETPLVHGGEYFDAVRARAPTGITALARRGLLMHQLWKSQSDRKLAWSDKFCFGRHILPGDSPEEKKRKAQAVAFASVSEDTSFDADDNFQVYQHTQPIRVYTRADGTRFPVFFNSIAAFAGRDPSVSKDHYNTQAILYDDDRTPVPEDLLQTCVEISQEIAYKHAWQSGDIVIIDNYQVSHGRLPWRNGNRKVLVSMYDTKQKTSFPAYVE